MKQATTAMSSVSPCKSSRQQGSVLLIALLLLWAMSYYLVAGIQALGHQNQWLRALSHNAQHHATARLALVQSIRQIETGRPLIAQPPFVVEEKNIVAAQNNTLYLLTLRRQDDAAAAEGDRFMQVAYGPGVRAVWLP